MSINTFLLLLLQYYHRDFYDQYDYLYRDLESSYEDHREIDLASLNRRRQKMKNTTDMTSRTMPMFAPRMTGSHGADDSVMCVYR